ncbi:hypothetical protein BDZ85DRAFT_268858 [Elsinoe ampelina]|uniref:Uncharacterized protein n=1 Tax=Elsinoe ampelina TaxID=302913 RepID=A0A6A6G0V7_9PEZI|nr:hypothetical protein BDZ85DRAFT_268858 [Elsinoe ampelina]
MIESCRRLIALRMEGFSRNYEKDIANVRLNATKSRNTNYFAQSLGPLFDDLEQESGTGYKLRVIGKCKDFVDAEDDNVITPSLRIFFDSLRAVKSEHAGALDEGNHREFRFLCSKLTCTMEKGGAFDAAQKDGSRFLKKTTGKGVKLVERMMQELKDMIDTWVIVPEMTDVTEMLIKIEDHVVEDEAVQMGIEQDIQSPPHVAPMAQMMSDRGLDGSVDLEQNTGADTTY